MSVLPSKISLLNRKSLLVLSSSLWMNHHPWWMTLWSAATAPPPTNVAVAEPGPEDLRERRGGRLDRAVEVLGAEGGLDRVGLLTQARVSPSAAVDLNHAIAAFNASEFRRTFGECRLAAGDYAGARVVLASRESASTVSTCGGTCGPIRAPMTKYSAPEMGSTRDAYRLIRCAATNASSPSDG